MSPALIVLSVLRCVGPLSFYFACSWYLYLGSFHCNFWLDGVLSDSMKTQAPSWSIFHHPPTIWSSTWRVDFGVTKPTAIPFSSRHPTGIGPRVLCLVPRQPYQASNAEQRRGSPIVKGQRDFPKREKSGRRRSSEETCIRSERYGELLWMREEEHMKSNCQGRPETMLQ